MAAKSGETQKLINKCCAYINELIYIWENAETRYKENKNFAGIPANFLAIKLGLSKLGGDLPYKPHEWDYHTLKHDKKTDKNRTKRLRAWQERARKEGKLKTSWLKVKFDATKAQKLCDCLDEMLYMLKARERGEAFHAKGLQVNDLGLELGLIDQQWYIAMKAGLPLYDSPYTSDKWKWKKLGKELGIPLDGTKPPYVVESEHFLLDNWTDRKTLEECKLKAQALVKTHSTAVSEEIPSERRSPPVSLTRLVECWGGDMTRKKLRKAIDLGTVRAVKITRQTYVFDTDKFPAHVIEKLRKE